VSTLSPWPGRPTKGMQSISIDEALTPSDDREYLVDRVRALDVAADPASPSAMGVDQTLPDHRVNEEIGRDVSRFIAVLRRVFYVDGVRTPIIPAVDADAITATSRMLARLGATAPQIVSDGLDRGSQYWISMGKFPWLKPRDPQLSPAKFGEIEAGIAPSTKPFYVGLYTCTGYADGQGMWRAYIESAVSGSGFERPWHVWRVSASFSARVCEVNTARAWADLNMRYPLIKGELIYPNWLAIAEDYDAVHLTVMAIAAIQGVRISTEVGLIAPSYWDVESTLWLRWSFDVASEVEIVG
jgi:hypothetical protein